MKKKSMALVLALTLLLVAVIGGTVAWLTDETTEVKNTFTTSNIDIELKETTGTEYKMIPGYTITKNPEVTVKAGSEECWLFVEVVKSDNFDTYMTYTIADGWTLVDGTTNVYARKVEATEGTVITADTSFDVIKDNKVTVKETVTKDQMNDLTENTYPTLTFKAYACQLNSSNDTEFTAAAAWAKVNPTSTTD